MGAIIVLEMKKNLQDKGLLFWMLLLPIIFTVLFIAVFTSGVDASVRNQVTTSIVPGYAVMFVFFIMITMVSTFIKDRDLGMTARLASTPLSPYIYLIGKWIPYIFIVFTQIIILLLFGRLVYGVPLEQPLILLILSLVLSFTATGIGLALSVMAKTDNMGIAITQIIALGGALLSGLWVPIEMMPDFLQTVSRFLPQYWAHQAFQDAMIGDLAFYDLFKSLSIMFGFGLIGFIIAWIQYPRFLKHARS